MSDTQSFTDIVASTVTDVVAKTAGVTADSIGPATTIHNVGISSLDAIEMLFQLEEKFDVLLSEREVDLGTATVADLVRAIHAAAAARKEGTARSVRLA